MSTIKHSGEPIEPVLLTTPPPFFFPFLIFTEPISLLIQPATLKVVPTSLFSSGDILTRKVLLTFFVRRADFQQQQWSEQEGVEEGFSLPRCFDTKPDRLNIVLTQPQNIHSPNHSNAEKKKNEKKKNMFSFFSSFSLSSQAAADVQGRDQARLSTSTATAN